MTETDDKKRLQRCWRVYLLEYELAKHYHYPYLLYMASTNRNPLLDQLLPSLLLVRAVSILDEVLQFGLDAYGITLPQGQHRDNLKGRIAILGNNGKLSATDKLQDLRCRRNELAHDILVSATWDELSAAVDLVEAALQELAIVGPRPKLDYFGERSAMSESPDPNVLWTRVFKCGIKENGKVALEFSWRQNFLKDNSD
jgi:hypothetical protein